MRHALGVPDNVGGVLVRTVGQMCDAATHLMKGDIVTHVDGIPVSNAGTIPFRSGERISLAYHVTTKFVGEALRVTLLRQGEQVEVQYSLSRMGSQRLVPVHDSLDSDQPQPEYIMIGGLVFQILSVPYMRAVYGENWLYDAPVQLIDRYYNAKKTTDGTSEIVVLSQMLRADVNEGYDDNIAVTLLRRFNGQPVKSLRHLAELVDACPAEEEYFIFQLDYDEVIILNRTAAKQEADSILATHRIPSTRSIHPKRVNK